VLVQRAFRQTKENESNEAEVASSKPGLSMIDMPKSRQEFVTLTVSLNKKLYIDGVCVSQLWDSIDRESETNVNESRSQGLARVRLQFQTLKS